MGPYAMASRQLGDSAIGQSEKRLQMELAFHLVAQLPSLQVAQLPRRLIAESPNRHIAGSLTLDEALQLLAAGRMAKLSERLGLDLADALARHVELLAHLLQRVV